MLSRASRRSSRRTGDRRPGLGVGPRRHRRDSHTGALSERGRGSARRRRGADHGNDRGAPPPRCRRRDPAGLVAHASFSDRAGARGRTRHGGRGEARQRARPARRDRDLRGDRAPSVRNAGGRRRIRGAARRPVRRRIRGSIRRAVARRRIPRRDLARVERPAGVRASAREDGDLPDGRARHPGGGPEHRGEHRPHGRGEEAGPRRLPVDGRGSRVARADLPHARSRDRRDRDSRRAGVRRSPVARARALSPRSASGRRVHALARSVRGASARGGGNRGLRVRNRRRGRRPAGASGREVARRARRSGCRDDPRDPRHRICPRRTPARGRR